MRDDYAWHIDRQISVAELVQVKDVRLNLLHNGAQVSSRLGVILLSFVHPFQAESGRPIIEPVQAVHPGSLFRHRNLAKADQRHAQPSAYEPTD